MTVTASWSKECFPPVPILQLQRQGCSFSYGSPAFLFSGNMTCFDLLLVNIALLKTAMKKKIHNKKLRDKDNWPKLFRNFLVITWFCFCSW